MLLYAPPPELPAQYNFLPLKSEEGLFINCLQGPKLCLKIENDENNQSATISIEENNKFHPVENFQIKSELEAGKFTFDNKIIKLGSFRYLIGISENSSTMYSGGGAWVSYLHLFELDLNQKDRRIGKELLSVPIHGSKMIRACFSENDLKDRRGACHDEYDYKGNIRIKKPSNGQYPDLILSVKSTTFPAGASLDNDNVKKLKKSEITSQIDHKCTFTRVITFDYISKQYELNKPIPDCADYLSF